MRELELRAWDEETKIMRYMDELGGICLDALVASDLIVEQYSGLKDKNGQKVFEGDIIVSKPNSLVFEPARIGVIKRSKIDAGWCYRTATDEYNIWTSGKYRTYEVIGNIHENAELLETGELV